MRYAIIDATNNHIVNVVEYDEPPATPPEGFPEACVAVQADRAGMDWTYDGSSFIPPQAIVAEIVPPVTVLSQDLMAQFTAADIAAIQAAISNDAAAALLWWSLLAQRDPMHVTNERFLAGWSALVSVLGASRMAAIATALGVRVAP